MIRKIPSPMQFAPRTPVSPGSHAARVYSIVELGVHQVEFQGVLKNRAMIRIGWELLDETIEVNGEQKPMVMFQEYSDSLHEKSGLKKAIEEMSGKSMSESESKEFDLVKLIGMPCILGVQHKTSKNNGEKYAKLSSIAPPMKSLTFRELSIPTVIFILAPENYEAFKKLGRKTREKIASSKSLPSGWDVNALPAESVQVTKSADGGLDKDGDEIPF
jgi:hypothetical protein